MKKQKAVKMFTGFVLGLVICVGLAVPVFAGGYEEGQTRLDVIVIDYRGGHNWQNAFVHTGRVGIPNVEIDVYVDGSLFETIVTRRHGTASAHISYTDETVVELRIVQAEGFHFDTEKILIDITDSHGIVRHPFILQPIDPELPLGGEELTWIFGSIIVEEYNPDAEFAAGIAGAEVNVYVNGELIKTVTTDESSMSFMDIILPSSVVGPSVEFQIVRADGFQFDSEKVSAELRSENTADARSDNLFSFRDVTWSLHPIEDSIQQPSLPANLDTATRTLRFAIGSTTFTDNNANHTLEAAPFIQNDRTMVPLRIIGEALGATDLAHNAGVITFNINGQAFTMTVGQELPGNMGTPVIVEGRTFVPLAFIISEMGATARWDSSARAAYIYIG